jgi:hypothetical protein
MIKKLWNGDVSLVTTYWIYGVLASIIFRIIEEILKAIFKSPSFMTLSGPAAICIAWSTRIFVTFMFIYFVFIFVAIWRSANKYTGEKRWARIAKLMVIIGAIQFMLYIPPTIHAMFVHPSPTVQVINKMIDPETKLLNITFKNNTYTYNCKLIHLSLSDLNLKRFNKMIRKTVLDDVRKKDFFKRAMRDTKASIAYHFIDKQNHFVSNVIIKPSDCGIG